MTDPLIVLGLDAADYELAQRWDCENMLLDNHAKVDTFAYTKEWPITAEVWPAIARGRHPKEDEGSRTRGDDWEGAMKYASMVAKKVLPNSIRNDIGRYLRVGKEVDEHYFPTGGDHMFGDGVVFNWPEITPAQNWSKANHWFRKDLADEITDDEYFRSQMALTGQELGWARAMAQTGVPIVGTRCHILDYLGHAWCEDEDMYRRAYEETDKLVGNIFDGYDGDIVVISDHGMQCSFVGDENPGSHSWRSMIGTTISGDLPEELIQTRDWLEEYVPRRGEKLFTDASQQGASNQQLRDLGYIE